MTTYAYDAASNLDTVTRPNGVTSDYDFDTQERLSSLTHRQSDGSLLAEYTYGRDDAGRINHINQLERQPDNSLATTAIDYLFDSIGRMTQERQASSLPGLSFTTDYVLDLAGNRLQKRTSTDADPEPEEIVEYLYNEADQLLEESATVNGLPSYHTLYGYDPNGSRTSASRTGTDAHVTTSTFDARNRENGTGTGPITPSNNWTCPI